jgi:hypothetical protein
MTRDDIIRLARKCEDVPLDDSNSNIWVLFTEQLEHFAALVAAAEREACAKVCDHMKNDIYNNSQEDTQPMAHAVANFCAEAIRARGEQLREALKTYGQHRNNCAAVLGGYQCTCGFNQQEQPR